MKHIKFLEVAFLTSILCISCTKQPIETTNSEEVKVSIDYAFPVRSGDMTPKGSSDYMSFYTKYIEGRILTPRIYHITFEAVNESGKYYSTTFHGKWGDKNLIAVPPNKYLVHGSSSPEIYQTCSDTCSLYFDDTLTVKSATITLLLKAQYACSLLLLDTTNVKSTEFNTLENYTYKTTMMKTEEFYHSFVVGIPNIWLAVTQRNSKTVIIPLSKYKWEAGKYYYFGNTGNNYTLAPMISNK